MSLWLKIGSAVLILAMIAVMWPQARAMLQNSPKGNSDDWRTFIFLILGVGLFVYLLTKMV
ncbi:MAG: hypothetical protein R3188_01805 [Acidiferrobacterales bacterium]|jgi:hypothetical protein|nr:hypothetical protein [Acidiferrobacterales bacterium]